jgi:hypothetical protein
MKTLGSIRLNNEDLVLLAAEYRDGSPAFVVEAPDGEPFMTVSVWLPESPFLKDAGLFVAKVWSENEAYREELLASGYFEDTGNRIPTGFTAAEVWRIKG